MLAVLSAETLLENTASGYAPRPDIARRPGSNSAACDSGTASGTWYFAGGWIHSRRKMTGRISSREFAQLTLPIA
jgi:hypothetical protein